MRIDYLFSSPDGDIRLRPQDLARPFLIRPSNPHPFLTLGDYFEAIRTFLLRDEAKNLMAALRAQGRGKGAPDKIHRIRIRSEKHGALYHVASIDIVLPDGPPVKLAVSTAVSDPAASLLTNEYETLTSLGRSHGATYLPQVYERGDVVCRGTDQSDETLSMMLCQWLEGCHEWHLSMDASDDRQKIAIWDLENGYRYAAEGEAFEILRQAARILTLYHDPHTFKEIYPWRHAAGDFLVKTGRGRIHVKLATARGYCSIMDFLSDERVDPLIAMVYFFLNMTIWMRLDRLDGVGNIAWAGDFSVQAVIEGFLDALRSMAENGTLPAGQAERLISLLQSLDEGEHTRLLRPLLGFYEEVSPAESAVIAAHLEAHVRSLRQFLRESRSGVPQRVS